MVMAEEHRICLVSVRAGRNLLGQTPAHLERSLLAVEAEGLMRLPVIVHLNMANWVLLPD